MKKGKIIDLIEGALCTDGAHHKQWYLEEILKEIEGDRGAEVRLDVLQNKYGTERGIAP